MKAICTTLILLVYSVVLVNAQTHTGDTEILSGKLEVKYNSPSEMSASELDNIGSSFGNQGIGTLHGGDLHLRGFWGVVIDKNGGNFGESSSYSNGVLPGGGTFAVRTRTSNTNFRTDFVIRNNGYVGISNDTPDERLVVNGNLKLHQSGNKIYWDWPSRAIEQYSSDGGTSRMIRFRNSWGSGNPNGGFDFAYYDGTSVMRIIDFKVGIGVTNPSAKLHVDGKIIAEEIKVENVEGADFVFEEDYDLTSLEETEQFIKSNKHLPGIPSAAEMQEEGLTLGQMNILLLQKIEELTLHLIEQNNFNQEQQNWIEQLEQELSLLRRE